jgi:large subunit ribosomal protein L13
MDIIIDATNKSLGRLATEIAIKLRGKNQTNYLPYIDSKNKVKVTNISKVKFTGKKKEQKVYRHHTRHPGGLKVKKTADFTPAQLLLNTIHDMLPKNRTRKKILQRLIIE